MLKGYRVKYTTGVSHGGVAIDAKFCACHAPKAGTTVQTLQDATTAYCDFNGGHATHSNTCRHHAGWLYNR